MATRKTTATPKAEQKIEQETDQKPDPKTEVEPESVTLEQALKEEDEGRTLENIKTERKNSGGLTKMAKATKIMEEMWDDIQSGKVKRKDVIKRFMEEVPLSKAGSSTYYGTIKARLSKEA